ncbi:MAG TPA: hypothetical protein VI072_16935 [Polyangiaceae bacterium]
MAFVLSVRRLDLTYPVPWPDEGLFLWQALAFRDSGGLLAPELCEKRDVFFMPPGYMVLQGSLFKLTGFSLQWARTLSALYVCGALACFAYIARDFHARFAHVLLFAAALSSPICRLVANTARMEALVMLTGAVGLVLLTRGRLVAGMAVIALAPLVHPNGLFIVAVGMLFVFGKLVTRGLIREPVAADEVARVKALSRKLFRFTWRPWELVVLATVVLAWSTFALYFVRSWDDFVWDLAVQLNYKRNQPGALTFWLRFKESGSHWFALMLLSSILFGFWCCHHAIAFVALASVFFLREVATVGWLYEYYTLLAFLGIAIVLVEAATIALRKTFELGPRSNGLAVAAFGALVGLSLFLVGSEAHSLQGSNRTATVSVAPNVPSKYVSDEARAIVSRYLQAAAQTPGKPHRVFFIPTSDALLFEGARSTDLRYLHSGQCAFHQADIVVLHDTPWVPEYTRTMGLVGAAMNQGVEAPVEQWDVLHSKAGNRWLAYQKPPKVQLTLPP